MQTPVVTDSSVIMSLTAFVENCTIKYYCYDNSEHFSTAVRRLTWIPGCVGDEGSSVQVQSQSSGRTAVMEKLLHYR